MHLELQDPRQATELCRYCLMCRHLCPITAVTGSEATSPHGWGLLIASVKRGVTDWNEDTVDALYRCADCGMCQAHCVTDQPLPLAINASRADVVQRQLAPPGVYSLQERLRRWGNPYVESEPEKISGQGEAALIVGAVGHYLQPETLAAAIRLLDATGVSIVPVAIGRESPHLPYSLGLVNEARLLGQATLTEIEAVGAAKVFVLSPGDVYSYSTIFSYLGLVWPERVQIVEVTTYLAGQLAAGRLAFNQLTLTDYAFYDPDHTVRVPGRWEAPRALLAALSPTPATELFWRKERAAPCGVSGGLMFTHPELSVRLARARLADAQARDIKTLITDGPQVLHHLQRQAQNGRHKIAVRGLFELLAAQL